jgi:hypothetical protein
MKASRRVAILTPAENRAWEFAFCFYREDCKSDLKADKLAWADLVSEFPRLKKFHGCR